MCGIISQDQYREGYRGYSVVEEYVNEHGETAMITKDPDGDISNIYSDNGHDYQTIWMDLGTVSFSDNYDEQLRVARQEMENRGFKRVVEAEVENEVDLEPTIR